MLARFRMTVKDCLQEYEEMSNTIFGNPRWISQRNTGLAWWSKYNAEAMSMAFEEVTNRRGERHDATLDATPQRLFATKEDTCSMFATTYRTKEKITHGNKASTSKLHLLRSYDHMENPANPPPPWDINFGRAEPLEIPKVARAATAAPMYFKEILIKHDRKKKEKVFYSDGGFGHTNNPTHLGIYELETLHTQNDLPGRIGAIVSIGTARADNAKPGNSIFKRVKQAFSTATDPQTVANSVRYYHRIHCWRLNDSEGLDIELDDWKPNKGTRNPGHETLALIRHSFLKWAHDRDNADMIRECASELVKRRRLRVEANRSKWERFATAAEFQCDHNGCRGSRYDYRHRFEAHLREHSDLPQDHACRTPTVIRWEYPAPSPSRSPTGM